MVKRERVGAAAGVAAALAGVVGVGVDLAYPGRWYSLAVLGAGAALAVLSGVLFRGELAAWLRRRSTRLGANSALMIALVGAILAMVNVLAVRHSTRLDLSQTGAFTLAPQTVQVLNTLPRDVKITAFFQKGSEGESKFKDLLSTYTHHSSRLSGEVLDPDTHPAAAKQYGITQYDTIVVESGAQEARIRAVSEQELTNALIRVGRDRKKRIAVLDGHGEPDLSDTEANGFSQAKEALEREGFEVSPLVLAQTGAVAPDTAAVIVAEPQKPLLPGEIDALSRYLAGGGRLFLLAGPGRQAGIEALASPWGVSFRNDTVIDPVSRLFGGDYTTPVIRTYGRHEIVKDFRLATFFPLAQSLAFDQSKAPAVNYQALALTSQESWGETRIVGGKARFDPGQDTRGPMDLAAAITPKPPAIPTAEGSTPPEPATAWRAVVAGNARFATNGFFNMSGNGDFFIAAVNWLAEERDLIAIRPKEASSSPLLLTAGQQRVVFWVPVLIVPGAVAAFGMVVWRRRRRL